ncbi:MAG: T9SS type A sorting domain-containing protein [Bacteroidales bacterium]|nr:T9SS type A sorting domain-containing protein [Bacteroidales bacterium]
MGLHFLLLILFNAPLLAQWSNDPTVNTPVVIAPNDQREINCISDGEGGMILTWVDAPDGFYNYDIYAQKLDKLGNPQWTTNGVPICTTTQNQNYPVLIGDGEGGAIISWQDLRNGVYGDIYAQKISSAGNIEWTVDGIEVCTAAGTQRSSKIISDGAGGAIIVWQDSRNGDQNPDIYVQKINSSGEPQWGADGIAVCTAPDFQSLPTIAADESGGAIISWDDDRNDLYNDIYAQKVDTAGNMLWTHDGIEVCEAVSYQSHPQIVSDRTGGAIITWRDDRGDNGYDIYAQWINSSGIAEWQHNGVEVTTADGRQSEIKIINDNAGGVIISWEDTRTWEEEFYAQRLNSQGNTLWADDGVKITNNPIGASNHVLIDDGPGGALIAWEDGLHIYAQKINSEGILQWDPDGVAISSENIAQRAPKIASDLSGGAIIAWEDSRNAPLGNMKDIYAQQISANGKLGEILSGVESENENPHASNLSQNYPNPFNTTTTIKYIIPESSFVTLKVFTALGEEVSTLVNEKKQAGAYRVEFIGLGLPEGIYLYRMQAKDPSSGSSHDFTETMKMFLMR